ncbi:hypothetical protein BTZ20_1097 [Rhodococcus sp. MTM3W5.2]|nr:hypothetical protein BTZ20_1097 [Rhodococcus sp. MTM3W5.2]
MYLLVRYGCTASHPCQALRMYLTRVAYTKTAVYLLLMPILARFSTGVANFANFIPAKRALGYRQVGW